MIAAAPTTGRKSKTVSSIAVLSEWVYRENRDDDDDDAGGKAKAVTLELSGLKPPEIDADLARQGGAPVHGPIDDNAIDGRHEPVPAVLEDGAREQVFVEPVQVV